MLEQCTEPFPAGTDADDWCGNAAWFPGFPWAMRALSTLGPSLPEAGVLFAHACHLGMLAVLWFGLLRDRRRDAAILALALAAVFPSFIYQDALFPISLTALSIVGSLALLSRRRFLLAGVVGSVAALSYSTGVLLALAGALAILFLTGERSWRDRMRAIFHYCAPITVAWAVVMLVLEWSVGRWDAWFLTQEHYSYESVFFASALADRVEDVWGSTGVAVAPPLQTAVVAVLMLACLGACAHRWRQRDDRDAVVAAFAVVFWIVPLSLGGYGALARAEALLVPIVALSVRLPRWVQVAFLVAFVPLGIEMGARFFDSTLV